MSEVFDRYARISEAMTERIAAIGAEQWSVPTPCTEWNVRDLVFHVIKTQRSVCSSLDGEETAPTDETADAMAQWRSARDQVTAALADEEKSSTVISGMFGEQPFCTLVSRLLCADTLIHTWDLSRATGQDERLDAKAVAKAQEFLLPLDEVIRRPGGFAEKIDGAAEPDEQVRFLNFCGRDG